MAALTPGQRALIALTQRTRAADIAARCGVSKSRVSEWVSGITTPSERARVRLHQSYGIPMDDGTWGVPLHRRGM